jgi:hypothetical protein
MNDLEKVLANTGLHFSGVQRGVLTDSYVQDPNTLIVNGSPIDNTSITAIRPCWKHVLIECQGEPRAIIECKNLVEQSQLLHILKQQLGRLDDADI